MAFVHGKNSVFKLDNSGGSLTDISTYVNNVDFPETADVAETSTLGSSNKSFVVGLKDATISVSCLWDSTVDGYIMGGTEPSTRTFIFGPAGSTSGYVKYTGECILTNYSVSNPVGDVVTYSLDLQCTGGVTRGTY